ncbi:hypothetical protein DEU56DRAFT_791632 [Suillus clintonianus]|uniref:uncharacterized protein n=1 Tax=Suillus clintonianus TaxID=1904413 RepID=UPI001B85F403|nr:uncharacterized protein DEU56DRAFT_791632 [Suillus clintonianus]KAG2143625.1 hypothetical protein DEU56DRAFT_791632 [Suillus clintonianus]
MLEYVYALHDFQPEHEDEVSFRAGEPIEVIEKDDQYSDGWWQGRNLAGKIGLFPKSYTTPAAPAPARAASPESTTGPSIHEAPEILQSQDEEAASIIGSDAESNIGVALGEPPSGRQEEVMQATMTDVQKAIEQLGRDDRDGSRSFSFASTRHGDTDRETDTETDGGTSLREDGEDWHRSARDKLAEQARKVVEAKAATDVEIRSLAPPIDIELSDESEAEEVDDTFQNIHRFARDHPHIPEEDEEDNDNDGAVTLSHSRKNSSMISPMTLPLEDLPSLAPNDGEQTAKVDRTSFSVTSTSRAISPAPTGHERNGSQSRSAPVSPMVNIFAPVPVLAVEPSSIQLPASPEPTTHATPTPVVREIRQVSNAVSSPSPRVVSPPPTSKHNSVASSGQASTTSIPQTSSEPTRETCSPMKSVPPSEWSVEEVVDWLKSKGFGQDVCDKFIEQEITGDVLLELDINLLKAEIGIVAFGKRMRIANAIAELRRPPSIIFPDVQPQHPQSLSHSHSYSYTHSRSGSTHQSLNSPMFATTMSSAITAPNSATFGSMRSPESPAADMSQFVKRVSSLSSTGASIVGGSLENNVSPGVVGLGLGVPPNGNEHKRTGSGQLLPSPSDGALNKRSQEDAREPEELQDDDRGALSEGENVPSAAKQRRRLFGRSTESTTTAKEKGDTSSNNNSTTALSASAPLAVTVASSRKRELLDDSSISSKHSRNKRDGTTRGTERHSLFGGTFTTSLGKGRKPPPRTSPSLTDESPMEKSSTLNLSRLYSSKKPPARPSTSDGSLSSTLRNPSRSDSLDEKKKLREKEKTSEKLRDKDVDSQTLKEKESSAASKKHADGPESQSRGPSTFKPGKSIIDQIGTPDHQGWMRKKGDHYNAWKVRYFVIKGPHLYILRSDNKTEVKIKGYINIVGYKVIADENVDPGRYGFRIVHDTDKTHFFSSDEQTVVREWMKAIMKATIGRDYSKPVVSSVNIPTIPLTVAQAMNPAPRPPSPTVRDATQKALRRENPNQLSTRDARVLMGLPSPDASDAQDSERARLDSFFTQQSVSTQPEDESKASSLMNEAPPRPTREARPSPTTALKPSDAGLIEWANSHLPAALQNYDTTGHLYSGLALLRLSESVLGKSPSPPVADSAFPSGPNDDKLDGLFRLFDFLLDNDVKMGSVSINDVRQGKRDKIVQLLKALKAWEDRRVDILRSIGAGTIQAGPFMAPALNTWKR